MRRSARRRSSTRRSCRASDGHTSAADDDEAKSSSTSQSSAENETTPVPTEVIAVEVTGATFTRQCAYLHGLRPTSQLPLTELDHSADDHSVQFASVVRSRPPASRRSSPVSADYGFVVTAGGGAVRRVPSVRQQTAERAESTNRRRATSETREYRHRRQEMTSSSSTTAASSAAAAEHQSRGRTSVRQLKRRNNRTTGTVQPTTSSSDSSSICSWRHSLCAGFKSSKCDNEDPWTESRPDEIPSRLPSTLSSVTVCVVPSTPKTVAPSRSQSLPRSFRSSFIAPLRRLLSSRSLSTASEVYTEERPSSQRLVSSASDSGSRRLLSQAPPTATTADNQPTTSGKLIRRSRSLERRTQQQRSLSRAASLNSRSVIPSQTTTTASVTSAGAREIYVEIPDQPWTRPFATVRLRPHHAADADRYQSSSGMLPPLCLPRLFPFTTSTVVFCRHISFGLCVLYSIYALYVAVDTSMLVLMAIFMPSPTIVGREHHVFGLFVRPSGRCLLTPVVCDTISVYLNFNETCRQYS